MTGLHKTLDSWLANMVCVGILAASFVSAQTPNSFIISTPNYDYPDRVQSLDKVEFRNLKVFEFEEGKVAASSKLRNGQLKEQNKEGIRELRLIKVMKFRFGQPGEKSSVRAIAEFDESSAGGSSSGIGILQVFEVVDRRLRVIQEIEYNSADVPRASFNYQKKILRVQSLRDDSGPHCCPTTKDIATFRWDGEHNMFVKVHVQTLALKR